MCLRLPGELDGLVIGNSPVERRLSYGYLLSLLVAL
jgi:hypothetical protein